MKSSDDPIVTKQKDKDREKELANFKTVNGPLLTLSFDGGRESAFLGTDAIRVTKNSPYKVRYVDGACDEDGVYSFPPGASTPEVLSDLMEHSINRTNLFGAYYTAEYDFGPALQFAKDRGNTRNAEFFLCTGVHVIAGGSKSGKTTLLNRMMDEVDMIHNATMPRIIYLEPAFNSIMSPSQLYDTLAGYLLHPEHMVIAIDSLRAFVYTAASGATGKGGVNMAIFSHLTALDNVARALGKAVIITLNYLLDDDSLQATLNNALIGSVTSAMLTKDPGVFELSTRTDDMRDNRKFNYTQFDDRPGRKKTDDDSGRKPSDNVLDVAYCGATRAKYDR